MSVEPSETDGGPVNYRPAVLNIAQPSVGSDATWNCSGAEYYGILAVSFTLATSAVVGTRTPVLEWIGGDGRVIVAACAGQGTTASSTARYTYAAGLGEWDFAGVAFASGPLPRVPIAMGEVSSVVIHIDTMDTADQLSAISIVASQVSVRPDTR